MIVKNAVVKKFFELVMIAILLVCMNACHSVVNALDFSLENQIYDEQSEEEMPATDEGVADTAEELPTPNETDGADETQLTQDEAENPQTSSFLYTLCVKELSGLPLAGARVTLYADGTVLYSALSDANGQTAWTLPTGCAYTAKAELDGYVEQENHSRASDNQADVMADIILCAPQEPAVESSEPSPTPIPVPAVDTGKVTITAQDTSVQVGDVGFSLLDGITAKDEKGEEATIWVVSDGGFVIDVPGTYIVKYAAMQGEDMVTASRTVTVMGTLAETSPAVKVSAPISSSNKRYQQLLAYRNEIYEELAPRMQTLSAEMEETIQRLTDEEANVRLMKQTFLLEGDSDEAVDSRDVETSEFTQVDKLSVSNWTDVLAVFIVKSSLDVENPLDLMELRSISLDGLDDVFWDMCSISVLRTVEGTDVLLHSKSYTEMVDEYRLNEERTNLLYELMQPEFQRVFASLTGNTAFDNLTSSEIQAALSQLPEDLSVEREKVVSMAYSLIGKVTYFWGGKYNALGWNSGWGLPRIVTSQGSKTTGKKKAYGLDCSGFVSWVFINAIGNTSVLNVIGNGSSNQWANSASIGWDEGQPGDLAFLSVPGRKSMNHVGIIVAVEEDGSYLVAHCSSSKGGVVVTEAWSSGFRYLRRPILYRDE